MTPERCVVIEDAPAGISAGRAGGMRVVAATTTHAPTELGKAYVIARRLTDTFRLELFVDDLAPAVDFYCRVLGFRKLAQPPGGYTPLERDAVRLALNLRAELPADHPIQRGAHERVGGGVELVLEVDDIDARHRHVVGQGWPLSAPLTRRPWRLTDFRVTDPDGYYWRVTSRA